MKSLFKFFLYVSCVNSNCLKDPAVLKRERRPTTKKLESTEFLCQIEGCNSQPFLGKSKLRGRPVVFSFSCILSALIEQQKIVQSIPAKFVAFLYIIKFFFKSINAIFDKNIVNSIGLCL